MPWRTAAVFGWLMLLTLIGVAPVCAQDIPKLIRVPVFFVTDRNLQSTSPDKGAQFGPHRKYVTDCKHDPFLGSGYCVVKNSANKPVTPQLAALGWAAAGTQDKEGMKKVEFVPGDNFTAVQAKFYGDVRATALKTDNKNVVLFAHGYKNSFEAAYGTAARFSYSFECPVILYSWPSVAKMRSYSSDENNNEWSQEHYNDVLTQLEKACTAQPQLKLRVFAHSMGSRLLVRAMPLLRDRPHIVEGAVVCPDVDEGLVKHYIRRYLSENGTASLRVYMSQRDKALALSQILHGGYCRLGECADSLASMVVPFLPKTANLSGGKPADAELAARIEKTKHRMQTIDFTTLDRGAIGHKIPVELMCNMSYTGKPGSSLKFVSEASGQRSRTSRVFSKLTRLSQPNYKPASDTCLRVVAVNKRQLAAK